MYTGKSHVRICEGESRMAELLDHAPGTAVGRVEGMLLRSVDVSGSLLCVTTQVCDYGYRSSTSSSSRWSRSLLRSATGECHVEVTLPRRNVAIRRSLSPWISNTSTTAVSGLRFAK